MNATGTKARPSKLDVERFRKVLALIEGGASPGERTAAWSRAEAMADAAGLSFDEASKLAKAEATQPDWGSSSSFSSAFSDLFNSPESRAARAEQQAKRAKRRRDALDKYGSEEAVFAETERERLLREATKAHLVRAETTGWETGSLSGWNGARQLPPHLWGAVATAYDLPLRLTEIWKERADWETLIDARCAFDQGEHGDHAVWVRARIHVLETMLDHRPASGFPDMLARQSWMEHLLAQEYVRDIRDDTILYASLRQDLERMAAKYGAPVQSGRLTSTSTFNPQPVGPTSTASQRRAAVMSILDDPASAAMSDREIARQAGVSPTTVGTLRRKRMETRV